jgi:hypothetical protein
MELGMDYTIYPYEGVGQIRLGMTPQQVREILGEPERQLPAGKRCDLPADKYVQLGFFVYYRNPGVCEAISMWDGSVEFQNVRPLGKSLKYLKDWFMSMGSDIQHFDLGFIAVDFGITINAQNYCPDLSCECDSLIIFERGYYNDISHIHSRYPKEVVKA